MKLSPQMTCNWVVAIYNFNVIYFFIGFSALVGAFIGVYLADNMENILKMFTSNRFKSFYWRTGMMAVAGLLGLIAQNIGTLEMSPQITVILGLVLGEISKALAKSRRG